MSSSLITSKVEAAGYCVASGICYASGTHTSCVNGPRSGDDCNNPDDCEGYDCHPYAFCDTAHASSPSCGGYPGCGGGCPAGTCNYGSCSAVTYIDATPPGAPPGTDCEATNSCSDESDVGYYCNPSVGCISTPYGGDSLAACSGSCSFTPTPGDQTDPNAGASSCPDVQASASYDFTYPGQTRYWTTWDKPPGNDAATRLENESPTDMVTKQYTSPGDMITLDLSWREPEGDFDTFYVEDSVDDTFYFFNGYDKPAVIFTQNERVLENALNEGYSQITWVTTADDSINKAKETDKRIYFMEGVDDNPWRTNDNLNGYLFHANALNKVPLVNCASILNASGHKDYYSTSLGTLSNDALYCYRRQQLLTNEELETPVYWPLDEDHEDPKIAHVSGNYLGLEKDLLEVRKDLPGYGANAIFGTNNGGTPIVPKNELLFGPRYSYFDNFMYAFMEYKGQYEARPDQNNQTFYPAYLRHAIIKIPTATMDTIGEHKLYGFTGPIYTDKCKLSKSGGHKYVYDGGGVNTYDIPAACSGFQVLDSNGEITDQLKAGKTYTLKTKANLESRIYDFYNSDITEDTFNSIDNNSTEPATPKNWVPIGDITTLQSVRCDLNGNSCPTDATDNRVLKVQMLQNANTNFTYVESEYAQTGSKVSGKKFTVEFWARSDASTNTVAAPSLQRDPYIKTEAPFDRESATEELHQLVFPLYDGTPSTTMTITSSWQKYSGTVIFPADVAYDSDTTRIRLLLKAPQNGGAIYYDNFAIIGTEKPTVNFNLVPTTDQCSQSTQMPLPTTNSLGETSLSFTVNNSTGTPSGYSLGERTPGQYYLFSHLQNTAGKHYIGNPDAVSNCGIDGSTWDDSIADTCMKEMTIVSCNENTPPAPTFVEPVINSGEKAYPYTSPTSLSTYAPQTSDSSPTRMVITHEVSPLNNKLKLRLHVPAATAANVSRIDYSVYPMEYFENQWQKKAGSSPITGTFDSDGTQTDFDLTISPTATLTNQIYIEARAVNGNSCTVTAGLQSAPTIARIIMLNSAFGYTFEVDKNDVNNFSCTENYSQALAKNATVNSSAAVSIYANGDSDSVNDNFVNFNGAPYITRNSINAAENYYFPHNINNSFDWKNRISSIEMTLPPYSTQESYTCLSCNQPDTDVPTLCRFTPNNTNGFKTDGTYGNANFFITRGNFIFDSWWQARGGLVASIGDMISETPWLGSDVSINCSQTNNVCQPFLGAKSMSGSEDLNADVTAGIPFTNSNTLTTNNGTESQNTTPGHATNANTVTITEDYDYFKSLFEGITEYDSTSGISFKDQLTTAAFTPDDPTLSAIAVPGDLTLNVNLPSQTLNVASNQKRVVLVEGNLNITGTSDTQITSVTPGGFLMFVVKGDIIINESIGWTGNEYTSTSTVLEGIFLANDDIIIQSKGSDAFTGPGDNKFVAAGSFIALNKTSDANNGIDLQRKFDDKSDSLAREKNSFSPVDMFIFRPDLIINTPEVIKRPSLTWKETN